MRSPYCGRLDQHAAHEWVGRERMYEQTIVRQCPGAPVVEGGNPIHCCDECGLGVRDQDTAPSCGAHRLHAACVPWFHCRECDHVRSEVPC